MSGAVGGLPSSKLSLRQTPGQAACLGSRSPAGGPGTPRASSQAWARAHRRRQATEVARGAAAGKIKVVAAASTSAFNRLRRFLEVRMWDVRPAELPRLRAALYRAGRIAYSTARALLDDRLTFRAAALTYFSVLSIVPFLAFAFAVLKGFGAYRAFVDGALRPYLAATFSANPALHDAIDRILQFVDQTDVSKLGAAGVVFLVYTSVSLVANVEVALNEIFGAQRRRALLRQVTDYVTLLVTAPLLLFAATTFSAAAQSSSIVLFLRETLGLGFMIDFALRFTSIAVVGVALFAIYMILPNVRVRPLSALLGAAVAAIGWQGLLVLHVKLQLGVARYNALYSVLGAIPIFLVWTYFSWLVVLVGATIAAAHQNDQLVRQRLRGKRADEALRETIAVAAGAQIARDFLAGGPRRTAADLGELLEVPPPAIEEILEALVRAGLLVRAVSGRGDWVRARSRPRRNPRRRPARRAPPGSRSGGHPSRRRAPAPAGAPADAPRHRGGAPELRPITRRCASRCLGSRLARWTPGTPDRPAGRRTGSATTCSTRRSRTSRRRSSPAEPRLHVWLGPRPPLAGSLHPYRLEEGVAEDAIRLRRSMKPVDPGAPGRRRHETAADDLAVNPFDHRDEGVLREPFDPRRPAGVRVGHARRDRDGVEPGPREQRMEPTPDEPVPPGLGLDLDEAVDCAPRVGALRVEERRAVVSLDDGDRAAPPQADLRLARAPSGSERCSRTKQTKT